MFSLFGFHIGLWLHYDKKNAQPFKHIGILINKDSLGFPGKDHVLFFVVKNCGS